MPMRRPVSSTQMMGTCFSNSISKYTLLIGDIKRGVTLWWEEGGSPWGKPPLSSLHQTLLSGGQGAAHGHPSRTS